MNDLILEVDLVIFGRIYRSTRVSRVICFCTKDLQKHQV
jgi:hypothetical protein